LMERHGRTQIGRSETARPRAPEREGVHRHHHAGGIGTVHRLADVAQSDSAIDETKLTDVLCWDPDRGDDPARIDGRRSLDDIESEYHSAAVGSLRGIPQGGDGTDGEGGRGWNGGGGDTPQGRPG